MIPNARARSRLRMAVLATLMVVVGLLSPSSPAAAQSADDIAAEIERSGRYLEFDEDEVEVAVDQANDSGIAFIWLDQDGGDGSAEALAGSVLTELVASDSRYRTVLVLMNDNFGAQSEGVGSSAMNTALDSALASFSAGAVANGVDAFSASIVSDLNPTPSTGSDSVDPGESTSGSGIGLGTILIGLLLLGGGFWLVRSWSRKRKADQELAANLAADRDEIREQLRDNADHVINLGDRVVGSGDHELIDTYERASQAYQQVSQEIEGAETVEEVDHLDDLIDQAEWEFEMIEARLEGRPVPPSPAELEAAAKEAAEAQEAQRRAEADKPALAPDESVITSGRTGYERPAAGGYYSGGRSSRGGFGGMGGGLGGLLGGIILGGMRGPQTRRTRRRSGGYGGGSLGGGVLRRSGSSRRSRGGRSLSSRRSGGSRRL